MPTSAVGGGGSGGSSVGDPQDAGASVDIVSTIAQATPMGARRLTRREVNNVLKDLLEDNTAPAGVLPDDGREPFDNVFATQFASSALIEGADTLAREAADRLMANQMKRNRVVGCQPTTVGTDAACFRSFITRFGRLAFRRPLTADEQQRFEGLAALGTEANDFYKGVWASVAAFLQHGNFLYRVEKGTASSVPGVMALNSFEVATRLSFLLWGSAPDDALLAAAERGELVTEAGIKTAAQRMLTDARAKELTARFHAQWIGYEELASTLGPAMQAETAALFSRIVFEQRRPWRDVFRYDQTFVSPALAQHYGLPAPAMMQPGWVSLQGTRRRGLMSQGSFLSIGATAATDTSPTIRGKSIYTNLLCGVMPPPPPDAPAEAAGNEQDCKAVKLNAHASGGCVGCHMYMDPVGYGLENYDFEGKHRTAEPGKPQCLLSGNGKVEDVGTFNGPDQLGQLLAASGKLEPCLVQQMYRFTYGRGLQLSPQDNASLSPVVNRVTAAASGARFDDILIEIVTSAPFRHRREETL
jgi:hypothetical protein